MHPRARIPVSTFMFMAFPLLSACKTASGDQQVRELSTRAEAVQQHAELAQQLSAVALESLQKLTARDFGGDALGAYGGFKQAVADSVKQEAVLRASLGPLKSSAEHLFTSWGADLKGFGNPALHQRSQERLKVQRDRYDAVVAATLVALTEYAAINRNLQDHVLFFGRDLNQEALGSVRGEVRDLSQRAAMLQEKLGDCRSAASAYAESIALPSVPLAVPAVPVGETSRSK